LSKIQMRLGHSPDPDDAFMFYAIAKEKVTSDLIDFVHVVEEIQSLNKRALKQELETTAISAHGYLKVQDHYRIMSCGASMGDGYGPIVVANEHIESLKGKRIAVPGKLTTAYLLLMLYVDDFIPVEVSFDDIIKEVKDKNVDAGLLIHEGQLTYKDHDLTLLFDFGVLWSGETSLPLPLGLNVVKRDISEDLQKEIIRVHQTSIEYSLAHKDEALEYAMKFGRGIETDVAEKFVLMYVNDLTVGLGDDGVEALRYLFDRSFKKGLITDKPRLDILVN